MRGRVLYEFYMRGRVMAGFVYLRRACIEIIGRVNSVYIPVLLHFVKQALKESK